MDLKRWMLDSLLIDAVLPLSAQKDILVVKGLQAYGSELTVVRREAHPTGD